MNTYSIKSNNIILKISASLLKKWLESDVHYLKIQNVMRKEFWLYYKLINSRPCNIIYERLQITRVLFSIWLSNIIDNDVLLINIDETCLKKATKSNYSWIPTGEVGEVLNTNFTNSMNIVLAIYSNGGWIEMLTNNKLNADKFVTFLQNLMLD